MFEILETDSKVREERVEVGRIDYNFFFHYTTNNNFLLLNWSKPNLSCRTSTLNDSCHE